MASSKAERGEPSAERALGSPPGESGSPPRTPSPSALEGDARYVGRYRLCFELSSGGMASVYLARADGPARFRKLVALKRVHPHLAKVDDFIEMFLDEAALAARIDHPNVCSVFDFGREGESYFLAMEYLVGEPLSRILRRLRKRPPRDTTRHAAMVARLIADACEGLHAAHELRNERGEPMHVVHRDISPDNIFVTYDGVPKIVDFGIASARERIHKTTTGLVKGKHAYMAPEQLGEGPVDRRADIWSMGVVLWESLCLRRLFRRETQVKTLYAVTGDAVLPPSVVLPSLPGELDGVVDRALTRDLDARCPTARDLSTELRRFLSALDEPLGAPEVAEWLRELFPEGRQQKRRLVEVAMSLPDAPEPVVADEAAAAEATEPEPRRRAWVPLAAALALLGLAAGGYVAVRELVEPAAGSSAAGPPSGGVAAPREDRAAASRSADRPSGASEPPGEAPTSPEASSAPDAPRAVASASDEAESGATESNETGAGATGSNEGQSRAADPPERAARDGRSAEGPGREASEQARGERRRDARPRARGTVVVLLPPNVPWAHVYHRGRRLPATAPGSFRLPAGRHVLEVRPMGRGPGRRVVARVRGGRGVTVRVPP
jgi:serine/threonine-protein kinase